MQDARHHRRDRKITAKESCRGDVLLSGRGRAIITSLMIAAVLFSIIPWDLAPGAVRTSEKRSLSTPRPSSLSSFPAPAPSPENDPCPDNCQCLGCPSSGAFLPASASNTLASPCLVKTGVAGSSLALSLAPHLQRVFRPPRTA